MKTTEVTRSVSRKISLGNYEMLDLFCSMKIERDESEAGEASKKALKFCWEEVMNESKKIKGS